MSKKNVVGIDLGTSFSSIARLDQFGRPEVLPNAEGEQMTPSVVYFSDEGVLIGQEALKSGSDDPERLIENSKRELGTAFLGWEIDDIFYSPVDIAVYLLGKLKSDAEEQIGGIDGAVISVPVHFSIQQRELTIEAARTVGLEVLGLVNEPVAAGLMYILGEHGLAYASLADEQTILVYDLGGGTFDLSIVHYSEEGIDVKAAAGDTKLGGIDWNNRLIDIIAKSFQEKRGVDIRREARLLRKLSENIESAKRSLSNPNKPWTNVSIRNEKYNESFKITRQDFEKATEDLVERTRSLTEGLVKSSVGRWDLIQQVLPVGGASRMPMIREAVRKMCLKTMGEVFGLEPNYRLSPDLAIAQGAALYAGLLAGQGPEGVEWAKQSYIPKMVSSRGLGLAVRNAEGERINHILIPANSPLPASVAVGVETIKPNQQRITLKIVEAEDEQYRDEDVLLRCEIANLPDNLPEGSALDVDLTYEPSGLLQIVAIHRESGRIATSRLKRDSAPTGDTVAGSELAAPESEQEPAESEPEMTESEPASTEAEPAAEENPAEYESVKNSGEADQTHVAPSDELQDASTMDRTGVLDAALLEAPQEELFPSQPQEELFPSQQPEEAVEDSAVQGEAGEAEPFILEVLEEEEHVQAALISEEEAPLELEMLDDIELLPLDPVEEVKPPPVAKKGPPTRK